VSFSTKRLAPGWRSTICRRHYPCRRSLGIPLQVQVRRRHSYSEALSGVAAQRTVIGASLQARNFAQRACPRISPDDARADGAF